MDDMQLLQAYVGEGSEVAFETILNRHLNLVYSTALRQVRDPVLAGEVTQTTFIILAKKAGSLGQGTILPGWLYRTAQFAATRALRTEARRRQREEEAAQMQIESSESTIWEQLAPILDQAMAHLGAADRNALVLRYFENKTARDVGESLGINEAAAQKRLARAVDKLRQFCTKKGVVLSAAALTGLLSANAVQAAPAGVVTATAAVLKGGAVSTSTGALTSGTLKLIAWGKLKIAAFTGLGVAGVGVGAVVVFMVAHWSEPRYQNRRISGWMEQLDNDQPTFSSELRWMPWQTELRSSPKQAAAVQAVQAMGTNAVPYLMAELETTNLSRLERWMGRSEAQLASRHRRAALALDALGPACKPWIPELNRLLHANGCTKEAAVALAAIGPDGWEVLTKALSDDGDTVVCSLWALGSHRAAVPGTIEALLMTNARNKPLSVDIVSLWALEEIQPDHEQLVPLLVAGLKADRPDVKWGSAVLLGRLGRKASSAVPALMALLQDTDPMIHHDAAQALEQIDPQAAARAGVTGALATEHFPRTSLY